MLKLTLNKEMKTEVVLLFEDKLSKEAEELKTLKLFSGKRGELFSNLNIKREGTIYLGLGDSTNLDNDELRHSGFKLNKTLISNKVLSARLNLEGFDSVAPFIVEGILHGNYKFDQYKSNKKIDDEFELSLHSLDEKKLAEITNLVNGVNVAKDFVNTPAFDLYPESYANKIVELFKGTNVEVEVFDKKGLEELGMKALLAVAQGSDREPRFVVMKYLPKKDEDHITFVGKGVTYDSGGYAIKPAGSMVTMQSDMAGSAAVVGAMKAINDNKLDVNVVAVTALAENLISGKAYKNGDIISSMKGSTIEVLNTDAEGRITLADSIYYAATKLNSTKIVELSTLTGACIVALGNEVVGSTSNNDEFYNEVHEAGLRAGELNWRFPVTKAMKDSVKGTVGDLKNAIVGGAGAITAGIFLEHFAEDKPFVHLDIAGPSFGKPRLYYYNGATGVGVRTLYELVK